MPDVECPKTLAEATDGYELLMTLRQVLAEAIDAGPAPRDLAALARRLLDVQERIDARHSALADELADLLVPQ